MQYIQSPYFLKTVCAICFFICIIQIKIGDFPGGGIEIGSDRERVVSK